MLRLRLMHRLGLLGPLLRAQRRVDAWAMAAPAVREPQIEATLRSASPDR